MTTEKRYPPTKELQAVQPGQYSKESLDALFGDITSLEELEKALSEWVAKGVFTREAAADIYDVYGPTIDPLTYYNVSEDTREYLNQWSSSQDLADRLLRVGIQDENILESIHTHIMKVATPGGKALRGAAGANRAEVLAQQQKELKQAEALKAARADRWQQLSQAVAYSMDNPNLSLEDVARINTPMAQEAFLSGESDAIMRQLGELNDYGAKRAAVSQGKGDQLSQALIESIKRIPREEGAGAAPPIPSGMGAIESFVGGLPYAQGTNLRNYLQSQIGDVVSQTQGAREDWWKRVNAPLPVPGGDREILKRELEAWGNIAATAPTEESIGHTYWGKGGLAAIAERAMGTIRGRMATPPPPQEEFDIWHTQLAQQKAEVDHYNWH